MTRALFMGVSSPYTPSTLISAPLEETADLPLISAPTVRSPCAAHCFSVRGSVIACAFSLGIATATPTIHARVEPDAAALTDQDAPSRGTSNVSPEVAREAAAIARQTMSPFCPGRTLSDCPSEYATAWRRDIREMVARGMSAAEIQKELESRVGENLSGSPNRDASYGVSIGLALGAALVLFFVLSKLRQNSRTTDKPKAEKTRASEEKEVAIDPNAVDDTRLEEELRLADGDDD